MKKIILLLTGFILFTAICVKAAPTGKLNKIHNSRVVSVAKDTTMTYAGIKIFIPAGHTLILGQADDGSIIIRGLNLNGVKVGDGTISAPGSVLLSVQPDTQVITVNRGTDVKIQDANGRTASLSAGASISAADIRTSTASVTGGNPTTAASVDTNHQEAVTGDIPAFVAESETNSAASEQATQDVVETEEVLSPSAP